MFATSGPGKFLAVLTDNLRTHFLLLFDSSIVLLEILPKNFAKTLSYALIEL